MKPAELLLRELATMLDMDELTIIRMGMDFDEVESLCRSVVRRLGETKGKDVLVRLAGRVAPTSPKLSQKILWHARRDRHVG